MMIANRYLLLCYNAAFHDPATRSGIRNIVIPTLVRRASELQDCREQCQVNPVWARDWREAGFVDEEQAIVAAIEQARINCQAARSWTPDA